MYIYLIVIQHPNTESKFKTIKGKNKNKSIIIFGDFHIPMPLVYTANQTKE